VEKIIIDGGRRLQGEVQISGAKNAALPILAATLLNDGWNTLHNIPNLGDIKAMSKLLISIGVKIVGRPPTLSINAGEITNFEIFDDLAKTLRASILLLGPLLARVGEARVILPGGDPIGARPINLHIYALKQMGAEVRLHESYIEAKARRLRGAKIYFDLPTVTGTENIMMAATLAEGNTVLINAAKDPEIVNLATMLTNMGARISGVGTDVITIKGVRKLAAVDATVIPDRIEAGTFMIAAGITGGDILVRGSAPCYSKALMTTLRTVGIKINIIDNDIHVIGGETVRSVNVKTLPYPGFPTDLQAPMMTLMTIGTGLSRITETIFENRFSHVGQLLKMGADIVIQGNNAIVRGVPKLRGADIMAIDLRGSASLILAGLIAEGTTEVSGLFQLDRGYETMEKKFSTLGADIKRAQKS